MRKFIYIIMAVLSMSSCAGWLSVDSTDRIMEDKLFEERDGFYTALNGVYVDMVKTSLYSGTFGPSVPDILAQYYDTSVDSHMNGSLAQYQAESKRLAVSDTWTRAYYLILNVNKIIEQADERKGSVLNDTDYSIIKGECLALRALLHFELFRYFAPSYSTSPAAKSIPYSTSSDPQVYPLLKSSEVVSKLKGDLDGSMELLQDHDPVITDGKRETDNGGRNLYNFRNLRMNYFAVKALAARFYMYLGNSFRGEALAHAEDVIRDASAFFPFSTRDEVTGQAAVGSVNASAQDRILSSDILFSVYNVKRGEDIYEKLFSNTLEVKQLLAMSDNGYRNLYPEEGDLRTYQWQRKKDVLGNDIMCMVKYEAMEVAGKNYPYMIPVLRMSEMYLIAAECYMGTDDAKAYELLNTVRNARQTSSVNSNLELNLENEYIREFVGEGQLFWYYKRKNAEAITPLYDRSRPSVTMDPSYYLFELPQSEGGYRE
jgi:hypothetical protein